MSLYFRGIAGLLALSGGLWSQTTFQITTATPLPNGNVGVPYALQLTATPGFSTPYTWTTSNLPPGLTLSSSGLISGTPTTTGPYFLRTVALTAQGSSGPTANKTLSVTIDLAPLTITPDPLNTGTINSRYSQIVTATGGSPPYAWSATSLPAGMFISASNGQLAGTPTQAGNFTVPVTVVDSAKPQNSATMSFKLVISSGLKINTTIISDPMVGVAYTQSLTANGGTTPYSWSISGSFLPAGLSIDGTTGTISGTASVAGAYNFTVKVTDAQQSSATQTFMGTVTTPINFLTPALANGVVGTPYSQQINATGGTPPLSFTLAVNPFGSSTLPPGLKLSSTGGITGTPTTVGTFATITVIATDSLANTATKTYAIIITAVQAALQVSPSTLTFSGSAAGDAPPPQLVTVLGAGTTPAAFTVTLDGGQANTPAPSWLKVTPLTGNTPGVLTVIADPSGLNAGSFNARILVNGVPVAVSLTVADAPPSLSVAPTFLRYAARVQSPGLFDQVIVVRNAGGGGMQSFSVTAPTPIPWLDSITPNSGQTSPNNPVFVRVRINTAGLTVGGYKGVVRFSSPGATINVPISVFVSAGGPLLNVDQTGMRFDMQQGQANGPADTIQVLNSGDPGTSVNFTASILNGAKWLTVSPNTGTATTTQSAPIQLTVTNAQNLAAGGYYALVQIADLKAQNSPQYVVVVLNVSGAGAPVAPVPTPQGLVFTGAGTQPVSVAVSGAATTFTASGVTTEGGSWLSVSPVSGTVSTASPANVNVTTNPAGLKAGVYTGLVNVATGSQVRGVNVTLIVPAGTGAAAGLETATTAATCTPTRVVLTQTGVVNNFTVPAGWPAALQMAMYDDCANALNSGSVFASFSNGDQPLSLHVATPGVFTATWQPVNPTGNMTINVRGSSGTLQPAAAQITGGVTPNIAPVLFANGTLNNYNPTAALSPGLIAQVYGSGLASGVGQPNALPLPGAFQGTSVMIGNKLAPLYYVSPGQINVQVPTEFTTGQQVILVSANGALTLPQLLDVNPLQAGIAFYADGTNNAIAQHADFSYVTASHPAKPGEVIIIYLAGMGATNPAVPSGQGAPTAEPLARVVNMPTVTVDGQNAPVPFAGLAPGFVGLYQIDLQVPSNARAGSLPLVVTQSGVAGNTTNLPVGQ